MKTTYEYRWYKIERSLPTVSFYTEEEAKKRKFDKKIESTKRVRK